MAATDYAILVGISRYYDSATFGPLLSPPNDVSRMKSWLLDKNGGDVPDTHITELTSPEVAPLALRDWNPGEQEFWDEFSRFTYDPVANTFLRQAGRLYLYFSGHGFSERNELFNGAAVFAAGATRSFSTNIYGTFWANVAKQSALFQEIVLVMDCCRDAELNVPYSRPSVNIGLSNLAGGVRLMTLYAAPKGGKAQERAFPELMGMTCGLLTHSFLKALKETPPDSPKGVSSSAIKEYMLSTWPDLCGDIPAAQPRFTPPDGDDIFFPAIAQGVTVGFFAPDFNNRSFTVVVQTQTGDWLVKCVLNHGAATVQYKGQATVPLVVQENRFTVKLQPAFYRGTLTGDRPKTWLFDANGETVDVEL